MSAARVPAELAAAKRQGYHSIGRAAALSGVTPKMIRRYEEMGLIPKAARTLGDYRVYSDEEVHTLRFVRRARSLGFSNQETARLLGLWRNQRRTSKEVKRLALSHVLELDRRIEALRGMRDALAQLAEHCHGDARPECPILDDLACVPDAAAAEQSAVHTEAPPRTPVRTPAGASSRASAEAPARRPTAASTRGAPAEAPTRATRRARA